MPKNQFQRPLPIRHNGNVPRHGKPLPPSRIETPRAAQPRREKDALPPLQALLARRKSP